MPTVNFVGNKAFCLLVSWVLRQRVSDTLCGTKVLLRRDYEAMPLAGRERWGDFDLLFGAARLKLRILEIPIHYRERVAGESKMSVTREGPAVSPRVHSGLAPSSVARARSRGQPARRPPRASRNSRRRTPRETAGLKRLRRARRRRSAKPGVAPGSGSERRALADRRVRRGCRGRPAR